VETKDAPSWLNQAAVLSRVSSRGNPHIPLQSRSRSETSGSAHNG